jgi:hypothetical protein
MKRIQKYTDEPLGRVRIVADFLPSPQDLVLKEDGVKITIALSRRSVDFFKAHAADAQVPYQKMIRAVLDNYTDRHAGEKRAPSLRSRRAT